VNKTATSSAYTPGPWYYHRSSFADRFYISHKADKRERGISDLYGRASDPATEANAQLIAAAPDLRQSSQKLYDALQRYLGDIADSKLPEELVEAMNEMEAAWHKADGTEPDETKPETEKGASAENQRETLIAIRNDCEAWLDDKMDISADELIMAIHAAVCKVT
jgi:hypothetical protein